MQEEYYKNLDTYEDLDAHKQVVLGAVEQQDRVLVEKAIKIVEHYHDAPRTLYRGNYNRHPVRVARVLLEEFGVRKTKVILIALCHDLGEWSEYDIKNLKNEFDTGVEAGVEALTWNPNDTWEKFFQKIVATGSDDLIKIKMADKLDNNRAAAFSRDEKEKQKAREKTEVIIRPFVTRRFPEYWGKFEESLRELV